MWKLLKRLLANYVTAAEEHAGKFLIVIGSFAIIAAILGSNLKLKSDLKELLPPKSKSVKALNEMIDRVGGTGLLIVVAESPNVKANKKFMNDLAEKLNNYPPNTIRMVSYTTKDIEDFYEKYALYYLSVNDLNSLYKKVNRKVQFEKLKRTPLFLNLMEDEGEEEQISDEIKKYKRRAEKKQKLPLATYDGYYGGEWGRLLVMLIRPYGESLGIDSAKGLIAKVKGSVKELNPSSYDSNLEIGYCGNVVSTVEEYYTLRDDILKTALLCILLVGGIISLYFLRIRAVIFLGSTLFISLCFTSALVYLVIGYLNAQTAFLGTVIMGTGINYGVILFARYLEERKRGLKKKGAMIRAMIESVLPTFLAAATTAVSFAVLAVARIRGLSQFGFIGSTGVLCCWITTMIFLPPLILYSERLHQLVRKRTGLPKRKSAVMASFTRLAARSPWFIVGLSVVAAMVVGVVLVRYAPRSVEYDFTKMRNQSSVISGTEALERRVSRLFRSSMTPAVAVVDESKDSALICDSVSEVKKSIPDADVRIGSCKSIYNLLPKNDDSERKVEIIKKMKYTLSGSWRKKLPTNVSDKIAELESKLVLNPPNMEDLPSELASKFSDREGNRGVISYVSPRAGMLLSDGRNLIKFADQISEVSLPNNDPFFIASGSLIFADLVRIIKDEAPILTLASFVGVILFIFITLRRSWPSFVIIYAIVWGALMMLGIAALMGLKINFFNFIVLPLTFGVGADYGINVGMRLRNQKQRISTALRHTGGAVVLCSMTTIIGYYVLTRATNQALASFGKGAVIGEFCCLFAAMLIVPALLSLRKK